VEFLEFVCRVAYHIFGPKVNGVQDYQNCDSIYHYLENLLEKLFRQIEESVIRFDQVPLES
jgi:hypothetical protein